MRDHPMSNMHTPFDFTLLQGLLYTGGTEAQYNSSVIVSIEAQSMQIAVCIAFKRKFIARMNMAKRIGILMIIHDLL